MKYLITGASRGLGLALTSEAIEKGHTVIAVTRSSSEATLGNLRKLPSDRIHILSGTDVSDAEGRASIKDCIASQKNGLDGLINNAGILIKSHNEIDFTHSFLVNSISPFLLTQELLPFLKESPSPRVVQISTLMASIADNSSGGYYAYRSSKAALNALTKSLALDNPEVSFCLLHPGWVKTEMGGDQAPLDAETSAKGMMKVIDGLHPHSPLKFLDFRGRELPW